MNCGKDGKTQCVVVMVSADNIFIVYSGHRWLRTHHLLSLTFIFVILSSEH